MIPNPFVNDHVNAHSRSRVLRRRLVVHRHERKLNHLLLSGGVSKLLALVPASQAKTFETFETFEISSGSLYFAKHNKRTVPL